MKMNEQRTRANSRLAEQDKKDRKEIHKQGFLFLFSFFFFSAMLRHRVRDSKRTLLRQCGRGIRFVVCIHIENILCVTLQNVSQNWSHPKFGAFSVLLLYL